MVCEMSPCHRRSSSVAFGGKLVNFRRKCKLSDQKLGNARWGGHFRGDEAVQSPDNVVLETAHVTVVRVFEHALRVAVGGCGKVVVHTFFGVV